MPVYVNPNARGVIALHLDRELSPRPEFYFKPLTRAQSIELGDAVDKLYEGVKDTQEVMDRAYTLLGKYIDGWANMPEGFTLENLAYFEVREILRNLMHPIEVIEKK